MMMSLIMGITFLGGQKSHSLHVARESKLSNLLPMIRMAYIEIALGTHDFGVVYCPQQLGHMFRLFIQPGLELGDYPAQSRIGTAQRLTLLARTEVQSPKPFLLRGSHLLRHHALDNVPHGLFAPDRGIQFPSGVRHNYLLVLSEQFGHDLAYDGFNVHRSLRPRRSHFPLLPPTSS